MEEARIRIAEGALSLFKPHSMLRPIASIFPLVPIEAEYIYILYRYNVECKWGWLWRKTSSDGPFSGPCTTRACAFPRQSWPTDHGAFLDTAPLCQNCPKRVPQRTSA